MKLLWRPEDFNELLAEERLCPRGWDRYDVGVGIIASTVANSQRDPAKKPRPYKHTQFMPTYDPPEEDDTPKQNLNAMKAIAKAIAAAWGRMNGNDRNPGS